MKRKSLSVIFFGFLLAFSSGYAHQTPLPAPYDSLQEVRPFVDHGWFANGPQLCELIRTRNVKNIIEVGSWLGKSTIVLANNLPHDGKIYAVDHWLGSSEHQVGQSAWHPCLPYLYEQFLSNIIHAGLTHKVIPMRMDSLEAAKKLQNVQVDLIYIDASHDTEAVYKDLRAWHPISKKNGGVLCGDDWSWSSVRDAVIRFARENRIRIQAKGNFWRFVE